MPKRRTRRQKRQAAIERELAKEVTADPYRVTLPEEHLKGALPVKVQDQTIMDRAITHDSDAVMPSTGIKVSLLVMEASHWWELKGAKTFRENRKSQVIQKRGYRTQHGPFALDIDNANFIPSGILHGKGWDDLNEDEKRRVVMMYHEVKYAKPMRDAALAGVH